LKGSLNNVGRILLSPNKDFLVEKYPGMNNLGPTPEPYGPKIDPILAFCVKPIGKQ